MQLPWSSLVLLVVPPVVLFVLALLHLLRGPRDEPPTQDTDPPEA